MQQISDTRKTEFDVARKLLTNTDFTSLHNRLNRFNVFEAFGHNEKEPRHTELLRYLLDPHEAHGLGDALLRNVLLGLCEQEESLPDDQCANGIAKLVNGLFGEPMLDIEATVVITQPQTQNGRIDLKVEIPYRGQNNNPPLLILIEMKLRARQGPDQLTNYSKDYSDTKDKILVYLTLDGEDSLLPEWLDVTYDDLILPSVESAIKAFDDKLDPEIIGLLKNYHEVLESLTKKEDSERADIVEKILKEIDTRKINWGIIKKLPVMRPYRRAIDEIAKCASKIEEHPMLNKFKEWYEDGKHKLLDGSTETNMFFLPSCLGSNDAFTKANSDLAGKKMPEQPGAHPPAAVYFEIYKNRNTDDGSAEVCCQIMLGPLKEGIDRKSYRIELRGIMGTKGRSGERFSKIGGIGKVEPFEEMIKSIDAWLGQEQNQEKLEQIKQFIALSNGV